MNDDGNCQLFYDDFIYVLLPQWNLVNIPGNTPTCMYRLTSAQIR